VVCLFPNLLMRLYYIVMHANIDLLINNVANITDSKTVIEIKVNLECR